MKKIFTKLLAVSFVFTAMIFFTSCDSEDTQAFLDNLGWIGSDPSEGGEDLTQIEDDINLGNSDDLPSSVDLSDYFPPIGDQGQYGTCVAWAVGYNHRSFLEAWDNNHSTDFTESDKFSPKYLFWSIPSESKGADCNGTGFEPAYDVLISKGISTLATTPYTELGDCSSSPSDVEDNEAGQYKIQSYREVDVNVDKIKAYLAQNRALSFGAKLGDNFMAANSDAVHSSDTYGYSGQHAYHAMTLCGYDDSKHAFRIVNTWGPNWGDNGYLWVDYDFFVNEFAFCAFAATNIQSNPSGDDNIVDDPTTGTDLTAWEFELETNVDGDPLKYSAYYNVYNTGTTDIDLSNTSWNILLLYYNAYDAEDWNIILYDYYTDEYGTDPYPDNNGPMGEEDGDGVSNWWNYVNVQSTHSVAYDLYFPDSDEYTRFKWTFDMTEPSMKITGDYYLVVIADGYDNIEEVDEDNNYFFFTDTNGEPIHFTNGEIDDDNMPEYSGAKTILNIPTIGQESSSPSAKTTKNLNTYSRDEIISMIKYHRKTGLIAEKAAMFLKNKNNTYQKVKN